MRAGRVWGTTRFRCACVCAANETENEAALAPASAIASVGGSRSSNAWEVHTTSMSTPQHGSGRKFNYINKSRVQRAKRNETQPAADKA